MILCLRSALFLLWFLLITTILSLIFLPVLVLPRGATCAGTALVASHLLGAEGLHPESALRCAVPRQKASAGCVQHMSMWDTWLCIWCWISPLSCSNANCCYSLLWLVCVESDRDRDRSDRRRWRVAQNVGRGAPVLDDGRPILIFPRTAKSRARCRTTNRAWRALCAAGT